ncbi:hypothetical protein B0H63DRAFT_486641, partial [Podospora didyma]
MKTFASLFILLGATSAAHAAVAGVLPPSLWPNTTTPCHNITILPYPHNSTSCRNTTVPRPYYAVKSETGTRVSKILRM